MIYDCFSFFNELDILEIRLNILNDVVDRFVLVESHLTHQGKSKPLFYAENQTRFAQFRDKIIHIVSENPPPSPQTDDASKIWYLENYQRDSIMRGIVECRQDDIVLISDVDEIPDPEKILAYRDTSGIKVFEQSLRYYYLNMRCWSEPVWRGTRMGRFTDILDPAQELSANPANAFSRKGLPTYFRFCNGERIRDGGWHFSYCGGAESIINKLKSIADTQESRYVGTVAKMDAESLQRTIVCGKDLYGRREKFYVATVLEVLPQYVQNNLERYNPLIIRYNNREWLIAQFWFLVNLALFFNAKAHHLTQRILGKIIKTIAQTLRGNSA